MALVLESRFTKDQILELYLNDVVARPARTVRDPWRRRSRAHLLRQGRQQRDARRSGDDRRPDPVAVAALAVPESGARAGAAQRRAEGDGRREVITRDEAAARPRSRCTSRRARSRTRRRTSSTTSASSSTRSSAACSSAIARWTSTRRSTCTCSAWRRKRSPRASPQSTSSWRRRSRARRRSRWSPSIRARARSWRSSAAAPTTQSQYNRAVTDAPPAGLGVQAVRLPRGVRADGRAGTDDLTPATIIVDEPTIVQGRREGLRARPTTRTNTTGR